MNPHESVKKEKQLVVDWLIEYFPNAFYKQAKLVKPLQVGIFDSIIEFYERLDAPPFSKKLLRIGLGYYSASPAYLNCQKAGVARIDLYGNDIDVVTEGQAKYAYQRYQQQYIDKKAKV
jgi:ProP effector